MVFKLIPVCILRERVIELSRNEGKNNLDLSLHLFSSRSSDLKGQSMLEMKTLKVAQGSAQLNHRRKTINLGFSIVYKSWIALVA